ncbi:C-GCAxxG-C-C family protein [Thermopirellula anaerolimosa]
MEKQIARRSVLSSLGLYSGGVLMAGCARTLGDSSGSAATSGASGSSGPDLPKAAQPAWKYMALDPDELADRAYAMYPNGSCMYSMVGSVMTALAEKVGEPFASFPFGMMRYGHGGVGGWGSICGVVNGAAAVIALFYQDDEEVRNRLIGRFARWYEATPLPTYQPKTSPSPMELPASSANSVLCHVSVSRWCEVSGCPAFSKEKSERCRRLTADGARMLAIVLNEAEARTELAGSDISSVAKDCNACHGKTQLADAMVKMDCRTCHTLPDSHPSETIGSR